MTSYERVMKRLRGQAVDRPPNFDIMMTFAAHYVGQPLSRYYLNWSVLCEANLAVQKDFALDIVQAISDPYREAADFGAAIEFPEDGLPLCRTPLVSDHADLKKIKPIDPGSGRRMSDRLAAIRALRERVGGTVPVMGWVEGALAEAADLRGVMELMTDLTDQPEWVEELLERCVEVEIAFAQAQIDAGADIIGLGDAVASLVSAAMYRQFALPYEKRIFAAVRQKGALTRLHICGNTTHLLPLMVQSGADIIDVDWMVNFTQAAATFGDRAAICGNFDPVAVMLQGTEEGVRQAVLNCLGAGGARSLSAAGCEIPDGTPRANLFAQTRTLEEFGQSLC
jgi:MtaA/CmuA family methyltransferase